MTSIQKDILELATKLSSPTDKMSLANTVDDSYERLKTVVKDSSTVNDHYGNKVLAVGNDDKIASFTDYNWSNDTLNYLLWLSLYNDSWVFKRAIDKPSQDEIKCGITIQSDNNVDVIYQLLKKYRFDLIQLIQWGALFGGSVAVMMFDNLVDEDYGKPINKDKLKLAKVMKMYVTDRWFGCAATYDNLITNMTSIDYGKPTFYNITFADGKSLKVHTDYIIRYEHRTAPKLVKTGQLQGWGYAEGSHILNELMRDDKLKSSIQSLVDKSLIEVIKMSGMRGVFLGADKENNEQLKQRLEMVNWARNYNSLTFLDKDDEYQMTGFSGLAGLSDLLQQNMWQISAALEMTGVLFGDLKQGFSTDVDALKRYSEVIHERCESYVRPVYDKLLKTLYIWKGIDGAIEYEFNSLIQEQEDEKRSKAIVDFIDTLSKLLNDGIITPKQYAQSLQTFTNRGIIDFGLTDEAINKLDDETQNEDFDLGNSI